MVYVGRSWILNRLRSWKRGLKLWVSYVASRNTGV